MRRSPIDSMAKLLRQNLRLVKRLYPGLTQQGLAALRDLTRTLRLSVSLGELLPLDGKWYVTHAGLLRIAHRGRCSGIRTVVDKQFSDPAAARWVFRATVYKSPGSKAFVGYGDADPSNVSALVRGAELRMAETRAVNRALRKAYSVGICSIEEIDRVVPASPATAKAARDTSASAVAVQPVSTGGDGQPRLRERLRKLMGQYRLDPPLVKRYATDFCGAEDLRKAPQEKLEAFVDHLAEWCASDQAGLRCKLNGYLLREEVKS